MFLRYTLCFLLSDLSLSKVSFVPNKDNAKGLCTIFGHRIKPGLDVRECVSVRNVKYNNYTSCSPIVCVCNFTRPEKILFNSYKSHGLN